jgi:hypothetical protein
MPPAPSSSGATTTPVQALAIQIDESRLNPW